MIETWADAAWGLWQGFIGNGELGSRIQRLCSTACSGVCSQLSANIEVSAIGGVLSKFRSFSCIQWIALARRMLAAAQPSALACSNSHAPLVLNFGFQVVLSFSMFGC
jgi:hypothetical protein